VSSQNLHALVSRSKHHVADCAPSAPSHRDTTRASGLVFQAVISAPGIHENVPGAVARPGFQLGFLINPERVKNSRRMLHYTGKVGTCNS
jgi:hypothetical protein